MNYGNYRREFLKATKNIHGGEGSGIVRREKRKYV
jgi:hypothetical protein